MKNSPLKKTDREVYEAIVGEYERQSEGVELIASENYVSGAVLEALGSHMTNKYSEGYPGKRYYGGQDFTDRVEEIAIERAKEIFHCDHANVQALSGAAANIAVYFSWLEPGDAILGMDLSHGGHLTHGSPVTYVSKLFKFVRYKMSDVETGAIDYDDMLKIARKENVKIILAGFSSYPRELDYGKISEIARRVGAIAVADVAHIAGLIAAGELKNPFDYGFNVVTTTTHKTLRGPRGALILSKGKVSNPLKTVEKTIENLPTLIDRSVFPGLQGGPHMNNVAAIAVALKETQHPGFKKYAKQVLKNASAMAGYFIKNGCHLITNGTDNHMLVIDCVKSFGKNGKEIQLLLDKINISTSKSVIPDDPLPPFSPSGLRIGSAAITTRGMNEKAAVKLAEFILRAVNNSDDKFLTEKIRKEVRNFCKKFPIPK